MARVSFCAVVALALGSVSVVQAAHRWGLATGTPDLKSAGQLAFGPEGILFVGDSKGGAVFAIDTGDAQTAATKAAVNVSNLSEALQSAFGAAATVNDLAVNPTSGNVYLSVSVGSNATPGLAKVTAAGQTTKVALDNIPFVKAQLSSVPEDKVSGEGPRARNRRNEAITDLAYVDGRLLVAGLANEASPSSVRELTFPFSAGEQGTSVEIYHAAHGRSEDAAPIRTFIPMNIDGKPALLAGYTCTPLVRFELAALKGNKKTKGTTVAELGNMNTPLDMIAYEKGGEQFLLMANTARGVMKISTKDIGRSEGLTQPVKGGGTAGQAYEKIAELDGTVQLDRLTDSLAVVVVSKDKVLSLKSAPLP